MDFRALPIADRWDLFIAFLRDPGGPFHFTREKLIAFFRERYTDGEAHPSAKKQGEDKENRLPSESWLEKHLSKNGAWKNGTHTRLLTKQTEYVQNWLVNHPLFQERQLNAFQAKFYRSASNVEARSARFIGRADELEAIDKAFSGDSRALGLSSMAHRAALQGIGGQGKTALAREYALTRKNKYNAVLWIDVRDNELVRDFRKFCQTKYRLKFDAKTVDYSVYLRTRARKSRGRILIVVDDIPVQDVDAAGVRGEVTRLLGAVPVEIADRFDFLLVSRQKLEGVKNMAVKGLELADALALFFDRAGRNDITSDIENATLLVDSILGRHALSIAILGAFAHLHPEISLQELIGLLEKGMGDDRNPLKSFKLEGEYSESLSASLKLTFEFLPLDAQYLLMGLGLFRRADLTIDTLRSCAKFMPEGDKGSAIELVRGAIAIKGGPQRAIGRLTEHGLLERVESESGKLTQVRLHEVIYDFIQAIWAKTEPGIGELQKSQLTDLAQVLTIAACDYTSWLIREEKIGFLELETLTGLILPIVNEDRNLLPERSRIDAALSFWFDHFRFQNYVYDTGLQELLTDQLERLTAFVRRQPKADPRHLLVLHKLLGHAYYADPKGAGGKKSAREFDEAISLARSIEVSGLFRGLERHVQWYKVFLLNHRSNLLSKDRPEGDEVKEIWEDPNLASDMREIEDTLPATLKGLGRPPAIEDCELLVRAGVYWGHRGNQDNYILYSRLLAGDKGAGWERIVSQAHNAYVLAANYRLLTLQLFTPTLMERHVSRYVRDGSIPHLAPWLLSVESVLQDEVEGFTSAAQGIGDAAHQYRGYHFVSVIAALGEADPAKRNQILTDADKALKAADILWAQSIAALIKGEVSLKYRLWMASAHVLQDMALRHAEGLDVQPLEVYRSKVEARLEQIAKGPKRGYAFAINEQMNQLRRIHELLAAV